MHGLQIFGYQEDKWIPRFQLRGRQQKFWSDYIMTPACRSPEGLGREGILDDILTAEEGGESWQERTNNDASIELMFRNLQAINRKILSFHTRTRDGILVESMEGLHSLLDFMLKRVKMTIIEHIGGGALYSSKVIFTWLCPPSSNIYSGRIVLILFFDL